MSLPDSSYQLITDISIGELHLPEQHYQHEKSKVLSNLNALNALQSTWMQEHIADLLEHGYDVSEVKRQLRVVYALDLEFINNENELTSLASLSKRQQDAILMMHDIEDDYRQAMTQAIVAHKEAIAE